MSIEQLEEAIVSGQLLNQSEKSILFANRDTRRCKATSLLLQIEKFIIRFHVVNSCKVKNTYAAKNSLISNNGRNEWDTAIHIFHIHCLLYKVESSAIQFIQDAVNQS